MNKEAFNLLEIQQQVDYINQGLEAQSLVKVCQAIGISEATVRDRFKNKGYTRKGKAFVSMEINTDNTTDTKDTVNTTNTAGAIELTKKEFDIMPLETKVKTVNELLETYTIDQLTELTKIKFINLFRDLGYEYKQYNNMNKFIQANEKKQIQQQDNNNIKVLEDKINSLEAQIKGIMDIINTTNTVNASNTIDTTELKKYEGTTVSRNYRINEDIQHEFKLLCNKFTAGTEYTVTDIISLALEDFINKHK